MIRVPAVAGSFYASTKEDLEKQIKLCFTSKIGPGLPKKTESKKNPFIAGVAPHAGYVYSGPVAAHLYKRIAESSDATIFVILGPNHTGIGSLVSTPADDAWATPLGHVKIDTEFARELAETSGFIDVENTSHAYEHSIEVQLPFLQYTSKKAKVVPICMMSQDLEVAENIGKSIVEVAGKKKVAVIASSDFSHYVPYKIAYDNDQSAIDCIINMDISEFYKTLQEKNVTACGYGPITAAMTFAKERGTKNGDLLKYATSGDTGGDKKSVVGYAAINF